MDKQFINDGLKRLALIVTITLLGMSCATFSEKRVPSSLDEKKKEDAHERRLERLDFRKRL